MLNRSARRKRIKQIANHVIKGREIAIAKPQYGIGLVLTTRMIAIMFWRWTWTPWDRRGRVESAPRDPKSPRAFAFAQLDGVKARTRD